MKYVKIPATDIELKYWEKELPLIFEYLGPNRVKGNGYYDNTKFSWFECLSEVTDSIYTGGIPTAIICLSNNYWLPNSLHLSCIEVFPEFRGKNVGSTIMQDLERIARSLQLSSITLQTRNPSLISYYQRFGYQELPVNDCVIMRKVL